MLSKSTPKTTKAIIKGEVNGINHCDYINLANGSLLIIEKDVLKLFSITDLNNPIAKITFDCLLLGIAPDNSIWVSSLREKNFILTKISSVDLSIISELKLDSDLSNFLNCRTDRILFINEKMFFCYINQKYPEKYPILAILKEEEGRIKLVQKLNFPVDFVKGLRISNIEKLNNNQFCCALHNFEIFKVLIFDLLFDENKAVFNLKLKNEIKSAADPFYSEIYSLSNDALLIHSKKSSYTEIWNIETNDRTKAWNWSKFEIDDEFCGKRITPFPDPTYLLVQVDDKAYLFNNKTLIIKEIDFAGSSIKRNPKEYMHILPNGQILSPSLKSNLPQMILFDLPEMIDFRKRVYQVFENIFLCNEVMKSLSPDHVICMDVNRIILFNVLEDLNRLRLLIEQHLMDFAEQKPVKHESTESPNRENDETESDTDEQNFSFLMM